MTNTVAEFIETRREQGRSIGVHIEGDPNQDRVISLAKQVAERVSADDSTIHRGIEKFKESGRSDVVIVDCSRLDRIQQQDPERWEELRRSLWTVEMDMVHTVLVAPDIPRYLEDFADFRVRPTEDGEEWVRVKFEAFAGKSFEEAVEP